MPKHIAIIGGGPAGYVAASHAAAGGASVTLIDSSPLGGTCLHRGCIPTKSLVEVCNLLDKTRHAESYGLRLSGDVEADWPAMLSRAGRVIGLLNKGINGLMSDRKVKVIQGRGRILDGQRVDVEGHGIVNADAVLVCTGSSPILPENFRVDDDVHVATSDELLKWESLPRSLTIVGDGVVACEFAFVMSVLGVKVTLTAMAERPLPFIDTDISTVVLREMRKRGITFIGNCAVERLETSPDGINVMANDQVVANSERVLVAIGRAPNSRHLGLEEAGVEMGKRGEIITDGMMRTNVSGLYAAGDVNGRLALAHAASAQAILAVDHILGREPVPLDDSAIPWAVFTMPEIGSVGLSEQKAIEKGLMVSTGRFDMRGLGKAQAMGELTGLAKIVADRATGRLLGVHIIGAHASDMVHEAAVLIRQGTNVHAISQTVHAHPTLSEAILEAAEDAVGQAVHKPLKLQNTHEKAFS